MSDDQPRENANRQMNVFVDVDQTLVYIDQHQNVLRPGAREALLQIHAAGHRVFIWSAGGRDYAQRTAESHDLVAWVHDYRDKDQHVQPRPDVIIDDDHYLVEKYGGYHVSQYRRIDEGDTAFADVLAWMTEHGML